MKKNAFILQFFLLFVFFSFLEKNTMNATHMVGGEISYKCLGGNNYQFTFVLYQNCLPGTEGPISADNPLNYAIYEGTSYYTSSFVTDYTFEIISKDFESDCLTEVPAMCLRKSIFTKIIHLPPSAIGYTIVYQRCCRNPGIMNLINSGNMGVTYIATIPPSTSDCVNSTPIFKNEPPQVICADFPFMYDYSATDADGDSLVYRLGPSYRGASMENPIPAGVGITGPPFALANYTPGLNYDNPVNAAPPVFINPTTGILTFTPITTGRYQLTVCVDEYREGVLFNTHYRDLQIIIAGCKKVTFADIPVKVPYENTYDVICDGYTVKFENSSDGNLIGFEWDFGDGSPRSNEVEPTHTYTDTGTYIVTLVVNKGLQCPDSIKRNVRIYPYLTGEFSFTGIQCIGEEVQFTDTVFNSRIDLPFTVEYDFGDGSTFEGRSPKHVFTTGGFHTVKMTVRNEKGCASVYSENIYIMDLQPFAGNDTIVVKDYNYHLQASGGDSYEWFPKDLLSDPFSDRTYVNFTDTGVYEFYVKVESDFGCVGYDTVRVVVVDQPSALLPNAFSPNGDGLNDVISPGLVGFPRINYFKIYDRWGKLMFVSFKMGEGWDGTFNGIPCTTGVYYYILSAQDINNRETIIRGDITLIR